MRIFFVSVFSCPTAVLLDEDGSYVPAVDYSCVGGAGREPTRALVAESGAENDNVLARPVAADLSA